MREYDEMTGCALVLVGFVLTYFVGSLLIGQ